MGKLNIEKLKTEFKSGVTPTEPIIPRKYTLTHSDITAELFLDIGREYAVDKITSMRDEVLAQWIKKNGKYYYTVYLYVDNGEYTPEVTAIRNEVFIRELPLALEAIRYGDREFFKAHPDLDNVPIVVYFKSQNPQIKRIEKWGTFFDYKNRSMRQRDLESKSNEKESRVIVTLLNPYIKKEVYKLYRKREKFCLNEVKIRGITEVKTSEKCSSNYDVAVSLRVGENPPPYDNLIIEFMITPNNVITKSVKQPR